MRVLYVTASMSPEWGGPTSSVAGLVSELSKIGLDCEIVTTVGHRVGHKLISLPGVKIHRFDIGFLGKIWTAYAPSMFGLLECEMKKFDLVHINQIWHYPVYIASQVARKQKVPYILSIRGELEPRRLCYRGFKKKVYLNLILKRILNSAEGIHTLTDAESSISLKTMLMGCRYFQAPNGVFSVSSVEEDDILVFLDKYPRLREKQIILFMSRLHMMKGLEILSEGFVRLASRFSNALLLIAGEDEDGTRQRSLSILKKAGVSDRVVFTGMLTGKDKYAALKLADIFVLPSYSEGFSNAIIEAMSMGIPVVISPQCHFPEVESSQSGLIVEVEPSALERAISELLSNEQTRITMGANARSLIEKEYTWPTIAKSFLSFYRTVTGG